jgi:exodeoxyribonuclease V gamma subunit
MTAARHETDSAAPGMIIYRASRLEALLDPLLALMQAAPPRHVLAPHGIIAAHPGMQKWLSREIALRRGPRGIAANLRIELPSEWLDRLALHVLGEEAVALRPYRREVLRWRIDDVLRSTQDIQVSAYLATDTYSSAQRRFQLADRLARIYTRYLVYRPDWLRDWSTGGKEGSARNFLAPLWKMLRSGIGGPQRGEMLTRLIAKLSEANVAALGDEPLHVFGLAHLAPSELAVLHAVARLRTVVLYVPDPCREYWGGLRGERTRLRELVQADPDAEATQSAFLEQGHPLLANWGRMGQHFLLALDDAGAQIDERHWQDKADTPQLDSRLHRLQESIRQLNPELIGEAADAGSARADRSLRIHACHTRLRELEALRDALLYERSRNPRLKASDIVVMMPDIAAYLPLLPTVFGEAGRHEGPLPYHCFDVAVARSHPLFTALRQLLDLPRSRITAPEVVDLFTVPQIARRLNLGPGDSDALARWLQNGRVAWALDAVFRARFDVPAIAEHTFAWGLDRMLAGYVIGRHGDDEPRAIAFPDASTIVPVEGMHGPQTALLGALDTLLVELQAWCALGQTPRRASEWTALLEQRLETIFAIDPTDRDAREAKAFVLRFVRAIASEPAESGLDPLLDFAVVRDVLLDRLDAVPERQRFLLGGVTFCGMVPQRAIPFEVIAVLGLNDGEFPRLGSDAGLDLMNTHRRLGDRDSRSDDRYLFLETVMSARSALHLSYIGEGVRDGQPRNPAAPLDELMAVLDAATAAVPMQTEAPGEGETDAEKEKRLRPWLVRHPLQPFDERYFTGTDAALFSFRHDFAQMCAGDATAPATSFVAESATAPVVTLQSQTIPLSEVFAYYKDPAKQLLAKALNLRLEALSDDKLSDSEPLQARFEAIDQVAKKLFSAAAATPERTIPEVVPDWLRLTGLLPPGRLGEAAWLEERDRAQALVKAIDDHELFAGGLPSALSPAIERVLTAEGDEAQFALQGELRRVYEKDGTFWVMDVYPGKAKESDLDFKARIGFFLEWALLRLHDPDGRHAVRACAVIAAGRDNRDDRWEHSFNHWDHTFVSAGANKEGMLQELDQRVSGLVEFWLRSQHRPQWYFPATSWAAVGGGIEAATERWKGGGGPFGKRGEREYTPGYARLLAGEREFDAGPDAEALLANALRLHALINLGLPLTWSQ